MISSYKINVFTFFKLPSCWWAGVRVAAISETSCTTRVKHRWFNQNPFNSMYFAVQAMAAELATGALVMSYIKESNTSVSMLVANNEATFTKKAKGRLSFTCDDGLAIKQAIQNAINTGNGQTLWMEATGINADGVMVSKFRFEWTVKAK